MPSRDKYLVMVEGNPINQENLKVDTMIIVKRRMDSVREGDKSGGPPGGPDDPRGPGGGNGNSDDNDGDREERLPRGTAHELLNLSLIHI